MKGSVRAVFPSISLMVAAHSAIPNLVPRVNGMDGAQGAHFHAAHAEGSSERKETGWSTVRSSRCGVKGLCA